MPKKLITPEQFEQAKELHHQREGLLNLLDQARHPERLGLTLNGRYHKDLAELVRPLVQCNLLERISAVSKQLKDLGVAVAPVPEDVFQATRDHG